MKYTEKPQRPWYGRMQTPEDEEKDMPWVPVELRAELAIDPIKMAKLALLVDATAAALIDAINARAILLGLEDVIEKDEDIAAVICAALPPVMSLLVSGPVAMHLGLFGGGSLKGKYTPEEIMEMAATNSALLTDGERH